MFVYLGVSFLRRRRTFIKGEFHTSSVTDSLVGSCFFYLFHCIPLFLPQTFFQKLDSSLLEFIWNQKTPQLCKQHWQRPKSLEDSLYQTVSFTTEPLHQILELLATIWELRYFSYLLTIEANSAGPASLKALLHALITSSVSLYTKNTIVKSLKIWFQFRRDFGLHLFSVNAPLVSNYVDGAFLCGPTQVLNPLKIYTLTVFLHSFSSCRPVFCFLLWRTRFQILTGP